MVSLKLPQFWTWHPASWFVHAEAEFEIRNIIRDSTKYAYVVQALESSVCRDLAIYLAAAPAAGKYDFIKNLLIRTYSPTLEAKGRQLLALPALQHQGEDKPSTLARRIIELSDSLDQVRQAILMDRLPADVQAQLATTPYTSVVVMAEDADRVMDQQRKQASVLAISKKQKAKNKPKEKKDNFICEFHRNFGWEAQKCRSGCIFEKKSDDAAKKKPENQ